MSYKNQYIIHSGPLTRIKYPKLIILNIGNLISSKITTKIKWILKRTVKVRHHQDIGILIRIHKIEAGKSSIITIEILQVVILTRNIISIRNSHTNTSYKELLLIK